ncbi:MAG: CBS domain-containing protein [Nitrospirota bacterium]|nr:CBS domain-containing protein [Nitrospirota bacterium]
MTRKVRDIMIRNVITVDGMATVRDALTLMRARRVKSLVVNRRNNDDAWGIVTLYDIVNKVVTVGRPLDMTNVFDIMCKPLITVSPGLQVKYAARLMSQFDVKRAVVLDDGELAGIISMQDIVYSLLDNVDGQ